MNTEAPVRRINEYLAVVKKDGREVISCQVCQREICLAEEDWRQHVIRRQNHLSKVVPLVSHHPRVYLHEYICPGCATMLDTQIVLAQEQS